MACCRAYFTGRMTSIATLRRGHRQEVEEDPVAGPVYKGPHDDIDTARWSASPDAAAPGSWLAPQGCDMIGIHLAPRVATSRKPGGGDVHGEVGSRSCRPGHRAVRAEIGRRKLVPRRRTTYPAGISSASSSGRLITVASVTSGWRSRTASSSAGAPGTGVLIESGVRQPAVQA